MCLSIRAIVVVTQKCAFMCQHPIYIGLIFNQIHEIKLILLPTQIATISHFQPRTEIYSRANISNAVLWLEFDRLVFSWYYHRHHHHHRHFSYCRMKQFPIRPTKSIVGYNFDNTRNPQFVGSQQQQYGHGMKFSAFQSTTIGFKNGMQHKYLINGMDSVAF